MILKWIEGFENRYAASTEGEILSYCKKDMPRFLKQKTNKRDAYKRVCLARLDGDIADFLVHRLILYTFVGPCPSGMEARHVNGNHGDNWLKNLCWGTPYENANDRRIHGTHVYGERHGMHKLTALQVSIIKQRFNNGETQQSIADDVQVSRRLIGRIKKGDRWAHM